MKHLIKTATLTGLLSLSGVAQAVAPLTEITSDSTDITSAGQSYSATLTNSSLSDFSNVTIDFLLEGDYDYSGENLVFNIEGVSFDLFRGAVNVAAVALEDASNDYNSDYYRLTSSVSLEQSVWDNIASDGEINISWENSDDVGNMDDLSFGVVTGDFVQYTIKGTVSAVPEPSTYALMLAGLGLVGFMSNRRRKS
jgi:hypothetical protein